MTAVDLVSSAGGGTVKRGIWLRERFSSGVIPSPLRVHLAAGDLPECWLPSAHVLEARAVVRLYKDLLDERGAWHQRMAATLFHQGVPVAASMSTAHGRAGIAGMDLSPAGRQAVETGLRRIDRLTGELEPLRRQLDMISRRRAGCRALRGTQFGVGAVTSVAIWAELGDVRRSLAPAM